LNCAGSGSWEGVIGAVTWVGQQYAQKKRPSTANMSLGGGKFQALNDAVEAVIRQGVTFAIAGGNNNGDACLTSPASTPDAITVGSTDVANNGGFQQDIRSSFSNWGRCTDIFAPGSMITSAWIGGNNAVRTISGTSMAAPHVCGVSALFLQKYPAATPKQVDDFVTGGSTKDLINLNCRAGTQCGLSPNRMIFSGCDV
jgi:serine protease